MTSAPPVTAPPYPSQDGAAGPTATSGGWRQTVATAGSSTPGASWFDIEAVRRDFPLLGQQIHGHRLVYLDNAATSQKPQAVLNALTSYYSKDNANVHRGVHDLSMRATDLYEGARSKARRFINAALDKEIVFVRGTSEAINLVASSYGATHIGEGDEVLITEMEHHSGIVPWQLLCQAKGARLKVVRIEDDGSIDLDTFRQELTPRTKLVSVVHVSNALGTVNPVEEIVQMAHAQGTLVLLDGAQAVPHMAVDVQAIGCDWYAFSGHKVFGPTGIGVLYGRADLLEAMPPYQGGGDMIRSVTFEKTSYNDIPWKFEAGTGNIAGAVGLGAALDYVMGLGRDRIAAYEAELLDYGTKRLQEIEGLRLIGTAPRKASVLSFVMEDVHPHDVGTILDRQGVAIRTGHHCAQPVMDRFGIPATCRASLALYNTREDIDALVAGLHEVNTIFR